MNYVTKRAQRTLPHAGWAVTVADLEPVDGEIHMRLYGAATPDRDEAVARVCSFLGLLAWDGVGELWPLSSATVACLRATHGEVWAF